MRNKDDCIGASAMMGVYFGALAGGTAGWVTLGPLGAVAGVLLGASAGILVGLGVGWLVCTILDRRQDVGFAKPYFTNLRLVATPDPAKKNVPCRIELRWTVDGNNDHPLCEISYLITAEGGNPSSAQHPAPILNNASTFGRAVSLQTVWDQEHDGREVRANVVLVARKGARVFAFEQQPAPMRVPVMP